MLSFIFILNLDPSSTSFVRIYGLIMVCKYHSGVGNRIGPASSGHSCWVFHFGTIMDVAAIMSSYSPSTSVSLELVDSLSGPMSEGSMFH